MEKLFYTNSNQLYDPFMSQPLPYVEKRFDKNVSLEYIKDTKNNSENG